MPPHSQTMCHPSSIYNPTHFVSHPSASGRYGRKHVQLCMGSKALGATLPIYRSLYMYTCIYIQIYEKRVQTGPTAYAEPAEHMADGARGPGENNCQPFVYHTHTKNDQTVNKNKNHQHQQLIRLPLWSQWKCLSVLPPLEPLRTHSIHIIFDSRSALWPIR